MNQKMIAQLQLIQVCKEAGAWQSPVCGNDCVAVLASDGEGAALQMACCLLENRGLRGMVNRKLHLNLRNLDGSHHAVPGQVQAGHVL